MNVIHKHVVHYLRVRHFWRFIVWTAAAIGVSVAAVYFNFPEWVFWGATGFLVLSFTVGGLIRPSVYYKVTRYELREEVLVVRTGFFQVSTKMIPIRRIQGAVLSTGPISRKYELANLTLNTASTTFSLPPLKMNEAQTLKREIIDLVKGEQTDV